MFHSGAPHPYCMMVAILPLPLQMRGRSLDKQQEHGHSAGTVSNLPMTNSLIKPSQICREKFRIGMHQWYQRSRLQIQIGIPSHSGFLTATCHTPCKHTFISNWAHGGSMVKCQPTQTRTQTSLRCRTSLNRLQWAAVVMTLLLMLSKGPNLDHLQPTKVWGSLI